MQKLYFSTVENQFEDLRRNPFGAVIVLASPFHVQGVGHRLSTDEEANLNRHSFRGNKETIKKHIARMAEIRHNYSVRK